MTLTPGTTLGRYQILEQLGRGGMATVYKAYEPSLDRVVALKVIRPGFAEDREFLERFAREARAVAKLVHPNIVQIFAFDQVEGRPFLAMQFLEGGTLKERQVQLASDGKFLDQRDVAQIVSQVAAALGYAHAQGVVHRDMKPSNVMLTSDGRAVVTDFGIAKILGGTQMTQTGVGIGTPEYMSPEQGQGGQIDARSDIYSLGVMAYELLTGQLPYMADTPFAVVLKHVRDPLPLPSKVSPNVGPATERVLLTALAKDPAQRYASATEFGEAMSRAIEQDGRGTGATVLVRKRGIAPAATAVGTPTAGVGGLPISVPLLAGGAAALLVLLGGGAVVLGVFKAQEPGPGPSQRQSTAVVSPSSSPMSAPGSMPSPSPTPAAAAEATSAPTPVPTLAPTTVPTPQGPPSVTLDNSTISASKDQLVVVFRNFPIGTAIRWGGTTDTTTRLTVRVNLTFVSNSDPYTVRTPWQGSTGKYVLHWQIGTTTYDLLLTVNP